MPERLVAAVIRKALTLRDVGCIFPNCNILSNIFEAHHIRPWRKGGATSLSNTVLLCPHHHTLVEPDRYSRHSDRWLIHLDHETRRPVITPPQRTQRFQEVQRDTRDLVSSTIDSHPLSRDGP